MNQVIDTTGLLKFCDEFSELDRKTKVFCVVGCTENHPDDQIDDFHADCLNAREESYQRFGEADYTIGGYNPFYTRRLLTWYVDGVREWSTVFWQSDAAQNHFVTTCQRALATLPGELSMNGPIFERPSKATVRIGAEIQWCRLVFRTLRGVGSYVRDFKKGDHQIAYLTVGLFEASARTAEILAGSKSGGVLGNRRKGKWDHVANFAFETRQNNPEIQPIEILMLYEEKYWDMPQPTNTQLGDAMWKRIERYGSEAFQNRK